MTALLNFSTGNQKAELSNKIISCFLPVFPVEMRSLYESFWKEFESHRRQLTLPVSNVSYVLSFQYC